MVIEAENVRFLKRAGLWIGGLTLATTVAMTSVDSDGPLYIGFKPASYEQEHSFTVGPLHIQYGKILKKGDEEITYRGGR